MPRCFEFITSGDGTYSMNNIDGFVARTLKNFMEKNHGYVIEDVRVQLISSLYNVSAFVTIVYNDMK